MSSVPTTQLHFDADESPRGRATVFESNGRTIASVHIGENVGLFGSPEQLTAVLTEALLAVQAAAEQHSDGAEHAMVPWRTVVEAVPA